MTKSVAVRLSLFYLAIIMALSIGFSVVIYRISSVELGRSTLPAKTLIQGVGGVHTFDYEGLRAQQLHIGQQNLRRNLILLNLATLILGAAVSYGLARRTLKPIEEAFEAQGRFTADASHELRTPLTAMQTSIEVGLRNPKLNLQGAKDLLDSTLDEVKKLSALSTALLKLTHRNGRDMPRQTIHIRQIAREAVSQLELAAKQKGMAIEIKVADVSALGDAVSLKELVVILLDNAVKYGTPNTTITVSAYQQGRLVHVVVADQGPGIKASDVVHLFDRFYRADTSRSRGHVEGYGLGLPIAQKIVEAHGGTIEVQSRLGEGSAFTVKVPAATAQQGSHHSP